MREEITYRWNWNNGTDFANWMTKQVAYKVLSEFWCWYQDLKKTLITLLALCGLAARRRRK